MKKALAILFICLFLISNIVWAEEDPIDESIEEPVEDPIDEPIEEPIEEPIDEPIEEPIEDPIEEPIEDPIEEPVEEPIEEPVEDPVVSIYFSEIAWMGTDISANDEWIELYNPNPEQVCVDGWSILNEDFSLEINLAGCIESESYYLLERTDDDSVPEIEADLIYTGSLGNDGEILYLYDFSNRLIDSIDEWHAGDNGSKKTMTRSDYELSGEDAWCNSDQINGSPDAENICEEIPIEDSIGDPIDESINNPPVPIIKIQGDTAYMHVNVTGDESYDPDGDLFTYLWDYGDGHTDESENPKSYYYDIPGSKTITLTVTDEFGLSVSVNTIFNAQEKVVVVSGGSGEIPQNISELPKSYSAGSIMFEKVLPNPDGSDSGNEIIELKNTTYENISLKGWKIVDLKNNHKVFDEINLLSKSTLEISQSDFKISLNNDEEALYLYDPAGNLIDQMEYFDAQSGRWILNLSFLYDGISGYTVNVIDGDTFKIIIDSREMTVRLIGVDTPETVHPYLSLEDGGIEASDFLENLILNKTVRLEFDENKTDIYGRILAYVFLSDQFVNEEIIKQGYGFAYTDYPFEYIDRFIELENQAKANGVGIWAGIETPQIEEQMEEQTEEQTEDLDEQQDEESVDLLVTENSGISNQCNSDFLKIHSFLPNPQKGETKEFIKLINVGTETVCLDGWVLDDVIGSGSKEFKIRGGSIASGAMRTFYQDETKLALNNSNDCVSLISPEGNLVDQICYGATHKNEIFNHEGGDYVPRTSSKKSSSSSSKSKNVSKDELLTKFEFINKESEGQIEYIYEEGEMFFMRLEDNSRIQLSYNESSVDLNMAKQMIDLEKPVQISYLSTGNENQLISIYQDLNIVKEEAINKSSAYYLLLIPVSIIFPFFSLLFKKRSFFKVREIK